MTTPTLLKEQILLLRQLVAGQEKQTAVLQDLARRLQSPADNIAQWRRANPVLAAACREAAESLNRAYAEHLTSLTEQVVNDSEALASSEFVLNEFLDNFGQRTCYLNNLVQMLCQFGGTAGAASTVKEQR